MSRIFWNSRIVFVLEILWTLCMGCGPRLGVDPPWTCRGEQLRWSGPRHGVGEAKVGWLVHHCGCHCADGWWMWVSNERERWHQVKLRWHGALSSKNVKWRRGWVVEKVLRSEWPFLNNRGWESGGLGRVADDGGVNLMLQFWLKRGGNETKH
jgi:hypothetical protein